MRNHAQRVMLIQICGIELPADGDAPRRAELGAAGAPEVERMLRLAADAGHTGGIEYEVFHDQLGAPDIEQLLDRAAAALLALME